MKKYLFIQVNGSRGASKLISKIEELAEQAFEDHTMEHGFTIGMISSRDLRSIRNLIAPPPKKPSQRT